MLAIEVVIYAGCNIENDKLVWNATISKILHCKKTNAFIKYVSGRTYTISGRLKLSTLEVNISQMKKKKS